MAKQGDVSANARIEQALQLTAAKGFSAGCQFIETTGDPIAVASAYNDFAQALYRQNKDVQHMIEAGRRGTKYALDHADGVKSDGPETAAKLREIAKTISFNVGANTWPGWGDDGIKIALDQRKAGIEAAALSLRLVDELNLGPQRMGTAHWLVGAHHIAAGHPEAALASLEEAARAFASAGDRLSEMMARGYCALARKLCPETQAAAQAELDQVLQHLGQEGSKAATFYQRQIAVADRILCAGPERR
jgi:tetratricopeptide (TPR) repeat protein